MLFFDRPKKALLDFTCFGITDDCMLKCRMCYKWKEDILIGGRNDKPSAADWKRCVVSLKSIAGDSLQINFGGGEPLLMEGILDLVKFSKSKGFLTNIASNGFLIDEAMAGQIAGSGLDSIILSLDSIDEDIHDYLRGVKGVHRRVMKAIDLLHASCGAMYKGLCCVIYDRNLDGILSLMDQVDNDRRINSIYFMAAMQPNNTVSDSSWHIKEEFKFLWPQDTRKVEEIIDELIRRKNSGSKITNQLCQLEAFKAYYREPEKFVKSSTCNMDSALHISSCGDIFLCYRWDRLGNIRTDDLAKIWKSDAAKKTRQDIVKCRNNCHFLLNCYFRKDES